MSKLADLGQPVATLSIRRKNLAAGDQ